MRFLAVSMPRRRGDGGLLVLPVWSTCSGLFWVFAISFSRFQLFKFFGQILFKIRLKRIRIPGQKIVRFWGPVLGARSGAQNWVTNTRFINNPCIWGQPGAQNWDQKRCPKLGTKMVTKCSPPAKKRPTSRRRNCKNHCTKLGPKTIAKTRIKFCAQNDSLTVAGYCNSGLASGSVWRRVGTARNHDCEARFFNISGSCFGHLIFGICHGDARRRYSRRPKKNKPDGNIFLSKLFSAIRASVPEVSQVFGIFEIGVPSST